MKKAMIVVVASTFLLSAAAFAADQGHEVAAPPQSAAQQQTAAVQPKDGIDSVLGEKYSGDSGKRTCHQVSVPVAGNKYVPVVVLLPVAGNEPPNGMHSMTPTYTFEAGIDAATARLSPHRWVLSVQDCTYGADGKSTRFTVGTKFVKNDHAAYFAAAVPFTQEEVEAKAPLHTKIQSGLYAGRWVDPAKTGGQHVVVFVKE